MASFKLLITASADKALRDIPQPELGKILGVIKSLPSNPFPHGCRKLSGEDGVFRIRVGTYRIIYEIDGNKLIILVLKIGHRKDIYRRR
jgi:mRNA interferase RelE/StbE